MTYDIKFSYVVAALILIDEHSHVAPFPTLPALFQCFPIPKYKH